MKGREHHNVYFRFWSTSLDIENSYYLINLKDIVILANKVEFNDIIFRITPHYSYIIDNLTIYGEKSNRGSIIYTYYYLNFNN